MNINFNLGGAASWNNVLCVEDVRTFGQDPKETS